MPIDLSNVNVSFVIDRSGSMNEKDTPSGKSRWDEAFETVQGLAHAMSQFDPDGLDAWVFNRGKDFKSNLTPENLLAAWKQWFPSGGTIMAPALKEAMEKSLARRLASPEGTHELIIVITDGKPDDQQAVAQAIVEVTQKMKSDDDLAVMFIQFGRDAEATAFLRWLDDNMKPAAKFDIIDAVTLDEVDNLPPDQLVQKAFAD